MTIPALGVLRPVIDIQNRWCNLAAIMRKVWGFLLLLKRIPAQSSNRITSNAGQQTVSSSPMVRTNLHCGVWCGNNESWGMNSVSDNVFLFFAYTFHGPLSPESDHRASLGGGASGRSCVNHHSSQDWGTGEAHLPAISAVSRGVLQRPTPAHGRVFSELQSLGFFKTKPA